MTQAKPPTVQAMRRRYGGDAEALRLGAR